ncbi:DUF3262 family protein [Halomonas coralii]|nr:DUF3262 family protein [Modicisalibacter sp. R2A 31.J]MBZ9576831.1 DUF3262 family protein [Modicisalibacter sp. MOD 31.J]
MTGDELYLLIAGVGCALALLAACWILLSVYRGFVKNRVDGDVLSIVAWRTLLLILLFFWVFL